MPVFVHEPVTPDRPRPAVLWIHGGGLVTGHPMTYHRLCRRIVRELGAVVVSVDYRLAPEHPFPAGLEDCYAALRWLADHAAELGVDPTRIAVAGDSAGGGLTATVCQVALDRGGPTVAFQAMKYPMLDHRSTLRGDHGGCGAFIWNPASNAYAWRAYLGEVRHDDPRRYASASAREDLAGLPPAWIGIGDLDLFYEESMDYAERLRAAGVPCEVHEVPGMYHAAEILRPAAPTMRAFEQGLVDALGAGLAAAPQRT